MEHKNIIYLNFKVKETPKYEFTFHKCEAFYKLYFIT